jgi:hypothetical protein
VTQYVFVADEMGTPSMSPGTSNAFVFGGYVVHERDFLRASDTWRRIKEEMWLSVETARVTEAKR